METLGDRLPDRLADADAVEDVLSTPTQALIDDLAAVDGDILVLGVGGKIGPTLARLAKRAAPHKRVLGVSRFTEPGLRERLESRGVETRVCDLLERDQVEALEKMPNVIHMTGRKFGTAADRPMTWAMNALAPAYAAEAFKDSRIVAFSTLCVYPFAPVAGGGSLESDPIGASGEYPISIIARERILEYYSRLYGTSGRMLRLCYAIDMRYGVLHEIATKVRHGAPIDLATGHLSIIWQGDAATQALRALRHCTAPASALNIAAPEVVSVRAVAKAFGRLFDREPVFAGSEADTAWLVNATEAARLFGNPLVSTARMIDWTADWVARNMPAYGKPTRYEARDGQF